MSEITKDNTLIVMAGDGRFPYKAYLNEGFKAVLAYKHTNTLTRILREVCFRVPLFPKIVWYNTKIAEYKPKYIYVRDAIITQEYLLWLQQIFPEALICFSYENMVGKARHLKPDQIPDGIRVWTYDAYDSEKYGLRLKKSFTYFQSCVKKSSEKKYDLLFVGKDKGRGDWLKKLEKHLNDNGLTTRFLITCDGKLSKKKPYYEAAVSYDQITDWLAESRAVLNIGMENQTGITMRDVESYFNRIKLVTTNSRVKDTVIYDESNTFFLTDDNWEELVQFLKKDYDSSIVPKWEGHRIEDGLKEVFSSVE